MPERFVPDLEYWRNIAGVLERALHDAIKIFEGMGVDYETERKKLYGSSVRSANDFEGGGDDPGEPGEAGGRG